MAPALLVPKNPAGSHAGSVGAHALEPRLGVALSRTASQRAVLVPRAVVGEIQVVAAVAVEVDERRLERSFPARQRPSGSVTSS
jgi:hypothetical protein